MYHLRSLANSCPRCLGPKTPDSQANAGKWPKKLHSAGQKGTIYSLTIQRKKTKNQEETRSELPVLQGLGD